MSLNPRSNLTDAHAAIAWNKAIASWNIVARGHLNFDLANPDDIDHVNNGTFKSVPWFPPSYPPPPSFLEPIEFSKQLSVGPLSAFSIEIIQGNKQIFSLYDEALELKLYGDIFAWFWPDTLTQGSVFFDCPSIVKAQDIQDQIGGKLIIAYEGSPIVPRLFARTGMIESIAGEPNASFEFILRAAPQSTFGSQRVHIPSPFCAPPFCPVGDNKGTHIFSAAPVSKYPSSQKYHFPKDFKTEVILSETDETEPFDARLYGGPWMGSIGGHTDDNTDLGVWKVQALFEQDPGGFDPAELATTGPIRSAYVPMDTGSNRGLRFVQTTPTIPCLNQVTSYWK